MKTILLASCGLLALALAACSSEAAKTPRPASASQVFKPIQDCKLELELVTPQTEFFRGDVAPSITFRLRNAGLKPITIYEWISKEQDNIRILYARCDNGKPDSIPVSSWQVYEPKLKAPVARVPLDLCPRNTALVNVELSFIKDALATAASQGKVSYALIGELNLSSASARTKPFIMTFK
jgi:hypothetical protein